MKDRGSKYTPADAIIVFGAAEYAGHPSPVWQARLDHAFDLFRQGSRPSLSQPEALLPTPASAKVAWAASYLERHRGIPERSLIAETQGSDTAQSAMRVAVIMRANGLHSCVAVSDAYHVFRIKSCWSTKVSIRSMSPLDLIQVRTTSAQRTYAVFREASSYLLWKLGMT